MVFDPDDPQTYIEVRGQLVDVVPDPEGELYVTARAALRQSRPAAAAGQGRPRPAPDERGQGRPPLTG